MNDATSQHPLPHGWRWVRLGEVCEINPRRPDLKRSEDMPTTFVQMSAVEEAGRGITRAHQKPFREVRKGYTYFGEGDVLFAKITPCMQNGKHAIARNLTDGAGFGSTEFHVLRTKNEIISEWVYHFVLQPWVLQEAVAHFTGAVGQQRVPGSYLAELAIPLPPLPEQQRIVSILSEQMAAVEQARAAAEARLEGAKALPAAYLRAVFNSPEAQQWPRRRLGEMAQLERGKFTPRPRNDPRYYDGSFPWIQIAEVESANKYITTHRKTLNERGLGVSKMFPKGTLVISIAATIGAVGILTFDSCMPDSLVGITPKEGCSDTEFLYFLLLFVRDHLESIAPQMAQANLKLALLEPLEVSIPPLSEQQRIAASLNEQMAAAEQAHKALEEQLEMINQLPGVLLRQAFNGEL